MLGAGETIEKIRFLIQKNTCSAHAGFQIYMNPGLFGLPGFFYPADIFFAKQSDSEIRFDGLGYLGRKQSVKD